MKKIREHLTLFIFLIFMLPFPLFAKSVAVDFYAAVSASKDTNMIRMTENLYFQQLSSLDGYTVTDKRPAEWQKGNEEESGEDKIIFFAEIQESPDSAGWICILNAINQSNSDRKTSVKIYDSYYKILLDAKNSLQDLLSSFSATDSGGNNAESAKKEEPITPAVSEQNKGISVENIAGNWTGEPYIEKIVILRGGKGFVIYKNGASMTIQVSVVGSSIHIQQVGRPNASFYPELPRDIALSVARNASPIEWELSLTDDNTLSGIKSTLEPSNNSDGAAKANIEVVWQRKK